MDEYTIEMAVNYMNESTCRSRDKFPFRLTDVQTVKARMLGAYGAVVSGRGVEFRFDDNALSKTDKVVKWMMESPKRGLLLCGTLGNGKTTMLQAMKNLFGASAVYFEAQTAFEFFKQNQCIPYVSAEKVLLIDDLGVEPPAYNDFGQIRYPLTELLMSRYKTNSTTVIASNCTFDQIGEIYGERLKDRMREMYAMITYVEPSYRK